MKQFHEPHLCIDPNNPFARDTNGKLVRESYWLDMSERSIILTMTSGIGANLENSEKRAHLTDIGHANLIDKVCSQEILPPED